MHFFVKTQTALNLMHNFEKSFRWSAVWNFTKKKGLHFFLKTQTALDSFHNFEKAPDDRWYEIIQRAEGSFPKKHKHLPYIHPPTYTHPPENQEPNQSKTHTNPHTNPESHSDTQTNRSIFLSRPYTVQEKIWKKVFLFFTVYNHVCSILTWKWEFKQIKKKKE